MRKHFMMLGMAALAIGGVTAAAAVAPSAAPDGPYLLNTKRGKGENTRRGKGRQAKPKKRTNRQIISKRVRRKHRRAA